MLGIRHFRGTAIDLFQGDITQFACDAIVNAANSQLAGGGGVDGAIHRAGGSVIMEECRKIGHCPTGKAVVTTGGELPAKLVIHTVGPIWRGGTKGEAELLRSAYTNSLKKAGEHSVRHLAFPSISTGAYRFPLNEAAEIALRALREYLEQDEKPSTLGRITFVLFNSEHYEAFRQSLGVVFPE